MPTVTTSTITTLPPSIEDIFEEAETIKKDAVKKFSPHNLVLSPAIISLNPEGTPLEVVDDFWSFVVYDGNEGKKTTYTNPDDVPYRDSSKHCFTIVFDMDETLLHVDDEKCIFRPYAKKILSLLKSEYPQIEIILWSAGVKLHVERCILFLDPEEEIFNYRISRGSSWVTYNPDENKLYPLKDLSRLRGRHPETVLIFDDSVMASVMNPVTSIIIPPFLPHHQESNKDTTLLYVLQVIARTFILRFKVPESEKPLNTTCFSLVKRNPFITRVSPCNSDLSYFFLDVNNIDRLKQRISRFNRIQARLLLQSWNW